VQGDLDLEDAAGGSRETACRHGADGGASGEGAKQVHRDGDPISR
jgi:hypothetical protein